MNNMNKISPEVDKEENDLLRILDNMDESQKAALHDFVIRTKRLIEGMMFGSTINESEVMLHDSQ